MDRSTPRKFRALKSVFSRVTDDYTKLINMNVRFAWLALFGLSLLISSARLVASGIPQNATRQTSTAAAKRSPGKSAPSPDDIADAKAKGLVWVNLSTHVYHKGGPLYGHTKRGKFMTEEDAKKAGYRLAKENDAASSSSNPK